MEHIKIALELWSVIGVVAVILAVFTYVIVTLVNQVKALTNKVEELEQEEHEMHNFIMHMNETPEERYRREKLEAWQRETAKMFEREAQNEKKKQKQIPFFRNRKDKSE